jgi:hypothetical protein
MGHKGGRACTVHGPANHDKDWMDPTRRSDHAPPPGRTRPPPPPPPSSAFYTPGARHLPVALPGPKFVYCCCAVNGGQRMGAVKKMQGFLSCLHNGDDGMHAQKDKAGAL